MINAKVKFIVDSGCSTHITNADVKYMYNCVPADVLIGTANGIPLRSVIRGSLGPLKHVLHAQSAAHSLLSVSNICDSDVTVIFTKEEVIFTSSREFSNILRHVNVRERGIRERNLYVMDINASKRVNFDTPVDHFSLVANAEAVNRYTLWHQRLNHCNHQQCDYFGTPNGFRT